MTTEVRSDAGIFRDQVRSRGADVVASYLDTRGRNDNARSVKGSIEEAVKGYGGRFFLELLQNARDAHQPGRSDGRVLILLDETEGEHGAVYIADAGSGFAPSAGRRRRPGPDPAYNVVTPADSSTERHLSSIELSGRTWLCPTALGALERARRPRALGAARLPLPAAQEGAGSTHLLPVDDEGTFLVFGEPLMTGSCCRFPLLDADSREALKAVVRSMGGRTRKIRARTASLVAPRLSVEADSRSVGRTRQESHLDQRHGG